jgi:hypothetical protein
MKVGSNAGYCQSFIIIYFMNYHSFLAKILDECKRNKIADQTARRLPEERKRERLVAEWSNMTTAETDRIFIWQSNDCKRSGYPTLRSVTVG